MKELQFVQRESKGYDDEVILVPREDIMQIMKQINEIVQLLNSSNQN